MRRMWFTSPVADHTPAAGKHVLLESPALKRSQLHYMFCWSINTMKKHQQLQNGPTHGSTPTHEAPGHPKPLLLPSKSLSSPTSYLSQSWLKLFSPYTTTKWAKINDVFHWAFPRLLSVGPGRKLAANFGAINRPLPLKNHRVSKVPLHSYIPSNPS